MGHAASADCGIVHWRLCLDVAAMVGLVAARGHVSCRARGNVPGLAAERVSAESRDANDRSDGSRPWAITQGSRARRRGAAVPGAREAILRVPGPARRSALADRPG